MNTTDLEAGDAQHRRHRALDGHRRRRLRPRHWTRARVRIVERTFRRPHSPRSKGAPWEAKAATKGRQMPKVAKNRAAVDEVSTARKQLHGRRGVRACEEGRVRQVRRDASTSRCASASTRSTPIRWCAARSCSRTAPARRVRVLVFAKGDKEKEAEAAGADFVGERRPRRRRSRKASWTSTA